MVQSEISTTLPPDGWRNLIPLKVVLAALSISRRGLTGEIAKGHFPKPVRLGGQLLWEQADLDQWFQTQRGGGK